MVQGSWSFVTVEIDETIVAVVGAGVDGSKRMERVKAMMRKGIELAIV